jgi:hypothetical protein
MGRFDHRPGKNPRDYDTPIYDDPQLGYYDDPPQRADVHLDTSAWAHKKFPPEYWSKYEVLRKSALARTHAAEVALVLRLDGKYHVQGFLPLKGKVVATPQSDRLLAWEAFISEFAGSVRRA